MKQFSHRGDDGGDHRVGLKRNSGEKYIIKKNKHKMLKLVSKPVLVATKEVDMKIYIFQLTYLLLVRSNGSRDLWCLGSNIGDHYKRHLLCQPQRTETYFT